MKDFETWWKEYLANNQHPLQGAGQPIPVDEFTTLRNRIEDLARDAFEAGKKGEQLLVEDKIKLLTDGLKQMLCTFDSPISRRRMPDQWSEDSRKFARECYEKATDQSIYG